MRLHEKIMRRYKAEIMMQYSAIMHRKPLAPVISPQHLVDAKLYADRDNMVRQLSRPTERVGEIGVLWGDFSRVLIESFRPHQFVAFDLFPEFFPNIKNRRVRLRRLLERMLLGAINLSDYPTERIPQMVMDRNQTHLEYYKEQIGALGPELICRVGDSDRLLSMEEDESFDVLYIDGDHSYEGVKRDIAAAEKKIKPDGLLLFNDYKIESNYGVVQAVNELIVRSDWKVIGFTLHPAMYSDIALRRC